MTMPEFNHKNHTIEMTKKFYKASCKFGTDEYEIVFKMLEKFPAYKPVIKTTSNSKKTGTSKKACFKGLDYEFMESYIEKHDNDKKEIRAEYDSKREIAKGNRSVNGYAVIKKWFLEKYPEFEEFGKKKTDNSKEETSKSEATETTTIKMSGSKEIA